jgi:hypothetical protein
MTEQDIAKLRSAGFSDADIDDYAKNEAKGNQPGQQPARQEELPEVDLNQPSETLKNATANGTPTTNPGSYVSDALAIGQGLVPSGSTIKDVVIPAGEGYLAYKGLQGWRDASKANQARAAADLAAEQGRAARFAARAPVPTPTAPVAPVAPAGAPVSAPVAPSAAPAVNPQAAQAARANPSMIQRGMDYANQMRQIAAQRVQQGVASAGDAASAVAQRMAPYARAGGGIAAALMPGNVGQDYGSSFPQSGPYKGMEINPNTGRPWTQQELAQFKGQ